MEVVNKYSKIVSVPKLKLLLVLLACFNTSLVSALTLTESASSRGAFVFPSGAPNQSSYDGPGRDTMSLFAPYVSGELLQINSFNSNPFGSTISAFLLSENAAFDGTYAQANNFGVVDSSGNFSSILNSKNVNPGDTGSLDQAVGQQFTFALQSPEGTFFSVDSKNNGGVAHMLAMQVTKAGTVKIPNANLKDEFNEFTFSIGDLLIFGEDMDVSGNTSSGLVPFASDFDYNDMVIVVRQTANVNAVPEPASMLLLGLGAGAVRFKRRKQPINLLQ